ncbi:MAG: hypothetical protein M1839_001704 [Geoglossum umbratile]|nr:MAG: hypothetical protein M1839_001704 [Geoglossum umbratile]
MAPSPVPGEGGKGETAAVLMGKEDLSDKAAGEKKKFSASLTGFWVSRFCGSDENYCFTSNGCQSNCVDPPDFYTVKPTPTTTVTATATPSPRPVLTRGQISGLIAGVICFVLIVIVVVLFWLHKRRTSPPARPEPMVTLTRTEHDGTSTTLSMPQSVAMKRPAMIEAAAASLGVGGPTARGGLGPRAQRGLPMPQGWTRRSSNSGAHYLNNLDDDRFEDVSSRV